MTVTVNETDILSELSFDYAPPCETKYHAEFRFNGPGKWLVDVFCQCGLKVRYIMCQECLDLAMSSVLFCDDCKREDPGKDVIRVVGEV